VGPSLDLSLPPPHPLDLSSPPPPLVLMDAAVARVPASSRGQISLCCNDFFMLQQMISNVATRFFLGCCNRCFCDVAVVRLEMLQYVSVASISCCNSCSILLHVFLFRALFHMLHTSVVIICSKCFSSFNLFVAARDGNGYPKPEYPTGITR
jgi:hypothetical protein